MKSVISHVAAEPNQTLDVTGWPDSALAPVDRAVKAGFLRYDVGEGWGDRTVVKLTDVGRDMVGMPPKQDLASRFRRWITSSPWLASSK